MSDDFKVFQNRADMNVIFVHSELDDRNLSAAEFRVYCHLARRSGGGKAWPGIDSMSRVCNLARGTVMEAIRTLEAKKMLIAERLPGVCTRYILTRFGEWEPCTRLNPSPNVTSPNEGTERVKRGHATSPNEGTKGNPLKVIQEGDNPAVAGDHQKFIDGWIQNFKACFDSKYRFEGGRDGKAVRELLKIGEPVFILLEIAKKAWAKPESFSCRKAQTIHGFNENFNNIQVEVKNGKINGRYNSQGAGNSANRNTGTLNEGKASQYRGVGKVV